LLRLVAVIYLVVASCNVKYNTLVSSIALESTDTACKVTLTNLYWLLSGLYIVLSGREEVLNKNYWLLSLITLFIVPEISLDVSPISYPSSK